MDLDKIIEENKQSIGNQLFSSITGLIQGQLKNSGVELKSEVVPVASSTKQEITNIAGLPDNVMKYLLIGGAVVAGVFLIKKLSKKAR